MLRANKKYLGETITIQATNDIVKVDGIKVRIPLKKIDRCGVYSFIRKDNKVILQHHANAWGMSAKNWDEYSSHTEEIKNNIFGDIFEVIDNTLGGTSK